MKEKPPKSYDAAYEELQQIIQQIQSGTIGLEQTITALQRAGFLIQYCKEKLRHLETEMKKLTEEIDSESV